MIKEKMWEVSMKRLISFCLVLILLCSVFAFPAAAEGNTYSSLVVLGDSISTGYGLSGSLYTRSSYSNLLAAALGLSQGKGYTNYAVDGYTSADILAVAKKNEEALQKADLIVMTNGGNDVLRYLLGFLVKASGLTNAKGLLEAITAIAQLNPDTVRASLYSEENEKIIANALAGYEKNLQTLMEYLKMTNSGAKVVVLKQYNPISGVPGMAVLDEYAEDVLGCLNAIMEKVVLAAGYELVDMHAVMLGNGATMSNIMKGDIHPNTLGHAKMFEALCDYLHIQVVTTTTATTTSTAVSTSASSTKEATPSVTVTVTEQVDTTTVIQTISDDTSVSEEPAEQANGTVLFYIFFGAAALGLVALAVACVIIKMKKKGE